GVKINAAPSLAKNAATNKHSNIMYKNILIPLPYDALTICIADHSKKPISSRIREIKITATNVKVAFQTTPVTSKTSEKLTTPVMIATIAPTKAVIPISSPLGCQITKIKVIRKMAIASIVMSYIHLSSYPYKYIDD